ncbi:MAG: hypothetical protein ACRDAM_12130, partial [Casimicrobium sp.]
MKQCSKQYRHPSIATVAAVLTTSLAVASAHAIDANNNTQPESQASVLQLPEASTGSNKEFSTFQWLQKALAQPLDNMDLDEAAAFAADQIPGFAGTRLDGAGRVRVQFKAGVSVREAQKTQKSAGRIQNAYSKAMAALPSESTLDSVTYDARELLSFKRSAFSVGDAVVWTYIDREVNRVRVGVDRELSDAQMAEIEQRIVALGVPTEAFIIEPSERYTTVQSSGGSIRSAPPPLRGGSQIQWVNGNSAFNCSVSIPASRNGVLGFITASHCGISTYSPGSTVYGSPNFNSPSVGTESADPSGFSCTLGSGWGACRYSDASFVRAASSNSVAARSIWIINSNTLATQGTRTLTATSDYQDVGVTVYKSGRTTGTTSGRVTQSCVDTRVSGSPNYVVLCANFTDARVDGGDSGGTWFGVSGSLGTTYYGVTSFKNSLGQGGYSPYGQIKRDLG